MDRTSQGSHPVADWREYLLTALTIDERIRATVGERRAGGPNAAANTAWKAHGCQRSLVALSQSDTETGCKPVILLTDRRVGSKMAWRTTVGNIGFLGTIFRFVDGRRGAPRNASSIAPIIIKRVIANGSTCSGLARPTFD